jgi:hypothetical protein
MLARIQQAIRDIQTWLVGQRLFYEVRKDSDAA